MLQMQCDPLAMLKKSLHTNTQGNDAYPAEGNDAYTAEIVAR